MKKIILTSTLAGFTLIAGAQVQSIEEEMAASQQVTEILIVEEPEEEVVKSESEFAPVEIVSPEEVKQEIVTVEERVIVEPMEDRKPLQTTAAQQEHVYDMVEQLPAFPGGQAALMKWIAAQLRYPEEAREAGIQGKVVVRFIVEKDGSISNPVIVRGIDRALDKEAVRIIKLMPKWQPGKNNSIPVRANFLLPITFKLTE